MPWWLYALIAALAAALTAVLAKVGVAGVPSNVATAVRTLVVVVFAWGIVFARQEQHALRDLSSRALIFLVLSGLGTGISWIAYFKALQLAPASRVAPIDKLSLAFTVLLAAAFLGESISWKLAVGVSLMILGSILTLDA